MKTSLVRTFITAIIYGLPLLAAAQSVPKQPVPIRVLVGDVSDYRSSSNTQSRCAIGLTFLGENLAEATDVIRVCPIKAVDDLKQDLIPHVHANAGSFIFSEYPTTERNETNQLTASVFLRSPARTAKTIKILEGEVELFMPTIANGGRTLIKEFSNKPQTLANNPALKKLGAEVTYQTKELFEAQKRSPSQKPSFLQSQWPSSGVVARVFVNTKNQMPLRLELLAGDQAKLAARLKYFADGVRCLELTNQPPLGSTLVITTMTPDTRQTFRFKVENIQIP